jgi:S-methylmethionine-dependent homocysteine/selenocysteine methylase
MTSFRVLEERIADGQVILLDGAVGTQLQQMGVPMDTVAWAATALHTHPYTVKRLHELYVQAGCDIITTNTYSAARHNLEPLGLSNSAHELNLRAVMLAQEARDRFAKHRPVYIAGSLSGFGLITGGEPVRALHRYSPPRSAITAEQARVYLREQAEILAEAGVDLLLVEATGSDEHREWLLEAGLATGLPIWVGFKVRLDPDDATGTVKTGHSSRIPLSESIGRVMQHGGMLVNVFHSTVHSATPAIQAVKEAWSGPIGVYPDAGRFDYSAIQGDRLIPNRITPDELLERACGWVAEGVQVIGGCCGYGFPYIRRLREGLPTRVPTSSRGVRSSVQGPLDPPGARLSDPLDSCNTLH